MNKIPIVFAFDNNIIKPACVCISSLMMSARADTFYDIFILHSRNVSLRTDELDRIPQAYENCSITYCQVDDSFESAFEIRGVTKATYYRLLVPQIITQYDKILYSDVDIIFRMDLTDVYNTDVSQYYIAATLDIGLNQDDKYLQSINVGKWEYLQAGFVLLNLQKMRDDNMVEVFKDLAKKDYKYQDQDILNISCKGKVLYLPPCYNVNDCAFIYMYWHPESLPQSFSKEAIEVATHCGNIHYSGYKPWKRYSIAFDIWWEYYRKCPFYDEQHYFKFFFDKTMVLDSLTLWKRIKVLARWFVFGRYKG